MLVDQGGRKAEQAGWFQRADSRDLLPLHSGLRPAVLPLADFGQKLMAFGLGRQDFHDRGEGPLGLGGLAEHSQSRAQVLVELDVARAGLAPTEQRFGGALLVLLAVIAGQ